MAETNGTSEPQSTEQQSINARPATVNLPPTSANDPGLSKRPRDARLIHMVLANLGVTAYQERVPLQLLDFAYRYTSSILQDALQFSAEGYGTTTAGRGAASSANDANPINLAALRLAIASRLQYQVHSSIPKEYLMEVAQEKNRVALPSVQRDLGLRLPPERYCLTGVGWGLKDEWESEGEEEEEEAPTNDQEMKEEDGDGEGAGEEDNDARMEDIFGDEPGQGDDEDREMGES